MDELLGKYSQRFEINHIHMLPSIAKDLIRERGLFTNDLLLVSYERDLVALHVHKGDSLG